MSTAAYRVLTGAVDLPDVFVSGVDSWIAKRAEFSLFVLALTARVTLELNGVTRSMGRTVLFALTRLVELRRAALPEELIERQDAARNDGAKKIQILRELLGDTDQRLIRTLPDGRYQWCPPPGFTYCLIVPVGPPAPSQAPPPPRHPGDLEVTIKSVWLIDDVLLPQSWIVKVGLGVTYQGEPAALQSLRLTVDKTVDGAPPPTKPFDACGRPDGWDISCVRPGIVISGPYVKKWTVLFELPRKVEPVAATFLVGFLGTNETAFVLPAPIRKHVLRWGSETPRKSS